MKKTTESIVVDKILSSQTNSKNIIQLASKNYCLSDYGNINHLFSIPGFSSAFDLDTNIGDLINDINNINIDTAYLQFFDFQKITEFLSFYAHKKYLNTKIIQKSYFQLDIYQKNILKVIENFKRGTRQKANSSSEHYELINSFDEVDNEFYELYREIAAIKNFSNVYLYTNDNFRNLSKLHNIFFIGIRKNSKLIAGSFFRIIDNNFKRIDYLLSASKVGVSSKWIIKIITNGIKLGIDKNCNFFNFGGGIIENDNLSEFKLSFGSIKKNFYNCCLINPKSDKFNYLINENVLNSPFFPNKTS